MRVTSRLAEVSLPTSMTHLLSPGPRLLRVWASASSKPFLGPQACFGPFVGFESLPASRGAFLGFLSLPDLFWAFCGLRASSWASGGLLGLGGFLWASSLFLGLGGPF